VTVSAHRKVVTVLFCDVVGSTALGESVDPETLQDLLARYLERMKGIVELHGGVVDKFIGDAVMAVFGVPVVHEDDALRACRAAVEMRDALPELGIQGRIGVNSGEVLTGTEERLATGDAVNVAARFEQAAEPGEVLIGSVTLGLVGDAVEVGEERLLELKGKSAPVAAYSLVSVREAAERLHGSRFVGRKRELRGLVGAWAKTLGGSRCELVTVVGDPGVGKSRLVAEALAQVEARVVRGRCLSYGEGITYWPVVEVVKQLDSFPSDESAANTIRSLLGESDAPVGTDEIAWAFRKLLEEQAPLVVSFDDIQWAEETFLDLVESTALLSSGAPLLLLCMARPELLDRRPGWPGTLRLEPLPAKEAGELVGDMVSEDSRRRIVRASGGNPLFLTEMVALSEAGGGDAEVPPTLRALLAARLDQLDKPERTVLERGAVEGELFHRGAVQALALEEMEVTPRLAALVRRGLVRPDRPVVPGEDAYRFRHLLIRDATYEALPKAMRTDLHRRFAHWLGEHGQSLVELDEIVGYHLEQACRYRVELGLRIDGELRESARRHLTDAGRRALSRMDYVAASQLVRRALAFVPEDEVDVPLEIDLAEALWNSGNAEEAYRSLRLLAERAAVVGDPVGEICSRLEQAVIRLNFEPHGSVGQLERLIEEAAPLLEAAEDQFALYLLHFARSVVALNLLHYDAQISALEQASYHAGLAGLSQLAAGLVGYEGMARCYGSMPLSQLLIWLEERETASGRDWPLAHWRAVALGMLGRFDEARLILAEFLRILEERGDLVNLGLFRSQSASQLELLAGDPVTAARYAEEGCKLLEEVGEQGYLSGSCCCLGQALYALDRLEEAEASARRGSELGDSDDVSTQTMSRQVQAKVLARRGQHGEAETLAREAVALADSTDSPVGQGDALSDLAEVLELAGRCEEAAAVLHEALERYERKEAVAPARRVRERLAESTSEIGEDPGQNLREIR
jgi:class 3 adenylate cyclase/tetratricopeptide (TPR) repeat protein